MRPFSLRHVKALETQHIKINLPENLRRRLWSTLQAHDSEVGYTTPDNPNWVHRSSVLEQTEGKLVEVLGIAEYEQADYGRQVRKAYNLHEAVLAAAPERVFDIVEVFFAEKPADERPEFQRAVNDATTSFSCPWRLADGMFFKVDSAFLEDEVIGRSSDLLHVAGLEGAMDEFKKARDHLTDGAARDAITYASHSFESTLKTILKKPGGVAKDLIEQFAQAGYMEDIPENKARAVRKSLMALSIVCNELGRHGQGHTVIEVPREYAQLAVSLAAAQNLFVVGQYLKKNPPQPKFIPSASVRKRSELDDDIPF